MPTPIHGFPLLQDHQSSHYLKHDEALEMLDVFVGMAIQDRNLTTPPGAPSDGDTYIPAATATDDWAGYEDYIAAYLNGGWVLYEPWEGAFAYCVDEGKFITYNGSSWILAFAETVPAAVPSQAFFEGDGTSGALSIGTFVEGSQRVIVDGVEWQPYVAGENDGTGGKPDSWQYTIDGTAGTITPRGVFGNGAKIQIDYSAA